MVMEWVPNPEALQEVRHERAVGLALTDEQEQILRAAFNQIDTKGVGSLNFDEFGRLIATLFDDEVGRSEAHTRLFELADSNKDGDVSFDEVRDAILQNAFLEVEPGRFYVVVSLAEAETLRALLHARSGMATPLGEGGASIALRRAGHLFEASANFKPGSDYQDTTAQQCYRFFDSELDYEPRAINVILRALQSNKMQHRERWFKQVRACRRRHQRERDWQAAPVARLFKIADEFQLLQQQATRYKIAAYFRQNKIHPSDFFNNFDIDQVHLLPPTCYHPLATTHLLLLLLTIKHTSYPNLLLAILYSPLTTRCSPRTTHHSPLTARRSRLTPRLGSPSGRVAHRSRSACRARTDQTRAGRAAPPRREGGDRVLLPTV